jgi:hypothetical protein
MSKGKQRTTEEFRVERMRTVADDLLNEIKIDGDCEAISDLAQTILDAYPEDEDEVEERAR